MTSPHATHPLAMTLRGYAGCGPSLWRPHLAAAADAVEEYARLRDRLDSLVAWLSVDAYCPCCGTTDACLDDCTFVDDDPNAAERMGAIRQLLETK